MNQGTTETHAGRGTERLCAIPGHNRDKGERGEREGECCPMLGQRERSGRPGATPKTVPACTLQVAQTHTHPLTLARTHPHTPTNTYIHSHYTKTHTTHAQRPIYALKSR